MPVEPPVPHSQEGLLRAAERQGLRLAIAGRSAAILLLGAWLIWSRAGTPENAARYLALLAILAALGALHYSLITTRRNRGLLKYAFVTLDVAIVSALVATKPLYETADLPQVMIYRATIFPFYFVLVAISGLSLSPRLVCWTGLAGALGWAAAFAYVLHDSGTVLDWDDVPPAPTAAEVVGTVLSPSFAGAGSRTQEILALLAVAALFAVVIARARSTLQHRLAAERDRDTLSLVFGQVVPEAIARAMIERRGVLAPVEREATVVFADIEGFTPIVERIGAVRTVAMLNAYFDTVTRIVADHSGIITEFLGDGVLVTFGVPLEDPAHADNAVRACLAIQKAVAEKRFAGECLKVRIGVNTGPVAAGHVGGGGRNSYTVYGETVNLAARLEALNREQGTAILVADATARALTSVRLRPMGTVTLKGVAAPVRIHGWTR